MIAPPDRAAFAPGGGEPAVRVGGAPIVNVANGLTMLRLALVPVVVALTFVNGGHETGWRIAAWGAFAVVAVTDKVDGELARRRNLVTAFGKLVDPIADKVLIGAALVSLTVLGDLAAWITITIVTREVAVTLLRFWVLRHGVIPASRGGKLKTLLQGLATGCYLLPIGAGPLGTLRAVLMGLAVIVTVVTGIDYVLPALKLRRTSARAAMKRARREKASRPGTR